jgi:H+/Cl- antiporter ClcA
MNLLTPRHLRTLLIHSRRWRRRLVFVAGGLSVGLVAVALAMAADFAQAGFRIIALRWPYAPLALTPLGFGLAAYLVRYLFPSAGGSGIPQVIAAHQSHDPAVQGKLVGTGTAFGKIVVTLIGLFAGASTGREGPTVQVSAAIMYAMGRWTKNRQPGLIVAGAAAGVAAAFNTPLAGIVFAIEEMSRSFEVRASGLIIGAVILAGMTSLTLVGNYDYFGFTAAALPIGTAWMAVPLCGVAGGFLGAIFARVLIVFPDKLPAKAANWVKDWPVVFAMLCGLAVALVGFIPGGDIHGTGYQQARAVLHGTGAVPLDFAGLKMLATTLSSISGIAGGIFSPSLAVGAGIGADIAHFFHHAQPGPIVLLGMVAYFTGVVRAPITGFVIVSEMTGNHAILVALMATALIADGCARLINPEGIYHMLVKRYVPH